MNRFRLYITLVTAVALCSCTREAVDVDDVDVPISLTCSMQLTRAYSTTQAQQVADGQTVSIWCDEHVDKTDADNHSADVIDYVKGWQTTVNSGALSGTNTYYYPKSGNAVDFYALHGNLNNAITEGTTTWAALTTGLTHTVATNQSAAGNLEQSDLLYAMLHNIAKTKTAQTLNFKHLMSKIEVYLLCGNSVTQADLTGATVEILNTKITGSLALSKVSPTSSTITPTGATADISARIQYGNEEITVPDPTNPGSTTSEHAYVFAEAIIVPQLFDSNYDGTGTGMNLIQVTLSDNTTRQTHAATYNFQPGKRYIFNVTVNAQDLKISGEITDWTAGTTSDITAY